MVKKSKIKGRRDARRAATVIETADITGVTTRTVQKVLNGEWTNEPVLSVFMAITEKHENVLEDIEKEAQNWTTIFNKKPATR